VIWPRYASRGHYAVILSMFYKREVLVKLEYSFVTIFLRWGEYSMEQDKKFKTIKGSKYGLIISTEKEISL